MRVAVGSENPVKRRAVEQVFDSAVVEPRGVDSAVGEQPVGHAETITGARNRAWRSFGPEVTYAVGLEGGVAEFSADADRRANGTRDGRFNGAEGLFLIMWAAVTDGRRIEVGAGPSVRLPDPIAREVASGRELGPLLDERLGTADLTERSAADGRIQSDSIAEQSSADSRTQSNSIAEQQGAIGVFTGGRITREDALAGAVACAAGPLSSR